MIEEQKLKALSIALEKLRQESIVNAYKAEMLTANQNGLTIIPSSMPRL